MVKMMGFLGYNDGSVIADNVGKAWSWRVTIQCTVLQTYSERYLS